MPPLEKPRPVRVAPDQPDTPEAAAAPESPDRVFAREALAMLRSEMSAQPAAAGSGPPPQRLGAPLLLVAALAGAFVIQRSEGTREMVAQTAQQQAEILAKFEARLAVQEEDQRAADLRATRSEESMREAFWILAEDSRANWDALTTIHEATKPAGAPTLRPPTTGARLSSLREALARE